MYASKDSILAGLRPREKDEESAIFGTLRLRELTRWQWRIAGELATVAGDDGVSRVDTDWWHTEVLAAGVVDPASPEDARESMFIGEELRGLAQRKETWEEIRRLANAVLAFSEVGAEALTKSDHPTDEGHAA
jgi:hypothetical protein